MSNGTIFLFLLAVSSAVWILAIFMNAISQRNALAETSGNYRVSKFRRNFRRASFAIWLVSLAFAYSPYGLFSPTEIGKPKDVAFVLDVSRSMDALDPYVTTSRIERAKSLISKIVLSRPQNRYSLTVFSAEAYDAIPPTTDAAVFETLMSGISTKYSQSLGTDFAKPLSHMAERFGTGNHPNASPAALVVFLSDGGDEEDTPETAEFRNALGSSAKNIALLAVTVGSEEGGNIPIWRDFFGNPVLLQKDGVPVVSKANPKTAKRIAAASRGESASESTAFATFRKWEDVVSPIESPDLKTAPSTVPGFVILAIAAFVAAFVIPDKMPVWTATPSTTPYSPASS